MATSLVRLLPCYSYNTLLKRLPWTVPHRDTAINENTLYSRTHNQNSRSRPAPWSRALESLNRDGVGKRPRQHKSNTFACRPAGTQFAVAYAETQEDNGDESVKSFGSEQMIIHRKVEYNVTSS